MEDILAKTTELIKNTLDDYDAFGKDDHISILILADIWRDKMRGFEEITENIRRIVDGGKLIPNSIYYSKDDCNADCLAFVYSHYDLITVKKKHNDYLISGTIVDVKERKIFHDAFDYYQKNISFFHEGFWSKERLHLDDILIIDFRRNGTDISNSDKTLSISYFAESGLFNDKSMSSNIANLVLGKEKELFEKLTYPIKDLPSFLRREFEDDEVSDIIISEDETIDYSSFVEEVPEEINGILNYGVRNQTILSKTVDNLLILSSSTIMNEAMMLVNEISELVRPNEKPRNFFFSIFNQVENSKIDLTELSKFRSDFEKINKSLMIELQKYTQGGQKLLNEFIPLIESLIEKCEDKIKEEINNEKVEAIKERIFSFHQSITVAKQALGFLAIQIKTYRDTVKKNNDILNVFYPAVGVQAIFYNGLNQQRLSLISQQALKGLYYGYLQGNKDLVLENKKLLEEINNSDDDIVSAALTELVNTISYTDEVKQIESKETNNEEIILNLDMN